MTPTSSFWYPPTWAIMGLALMLVLLSSLCVPLVAGLSMFIAIRWVHTRLRRLKWTNALNVWVSALLCVVAAVGLLAVIGWGVGALLDDTSGVAALMLKMTEALSLLRSMLPQDMASSIPENAATAIAKVQEWLQSHAALLPSFGKKLVTLVFHLVIGSFIGVMTAVAVLNKEPSQALAPSNWLEELKERMARFALAFENVFLAQINIALVNAVLTGVFLAVLMPLIGFEVPFVKTLTAVTFFLGLVPILGNVMSNSAIFLVCLSVSPVAAFMALAFLVVIHKLEYFLNAWIIGSKIHVKSHELLAAMLVCEALFGLWGLVLAPVLYAYFKEEASRSLKTP